MTQVNAKTSQPSRGLNLRHWRIVQGGLSSAAA